MPSVELPDGKVREYDAPVTAARVAADIGRRLAKDALGARINGQLSDLSMPIEEDCQLAIVTPTDRKGNPDPDALYLLRHSCAHVMAEAIQRLFPGVLLVYGPPVENGFFYDMALPDGQSISSDDFAAIEAEMEKIVAEDRPFTRCELGIDAGLRKLEEEGSKYKLDNARRAIDGGSEALTWYVTGAAGKNWEDLCRGPHVPSTGRLAAFKVMSVASSYWHGDANSDMLTRIYGTAFPSRQALEEYLAMLAQARERDHRVLGKQLELFHFDEDVGSGLVLWTPNGAVLRQELETFIRSHLFKQGYRSVYTPHIGKLALYKTSGHFPYYQESQFPPLIDSQALSQMAEEGVACSELANRMRSGDIEGFMLKPMNCPHHIKVFASQPRSYRDLPVRLAEFGTVYRWEQSGEIGGLTRVRSFTQDDAHLFCTEEQLGAELVGCLELVQIIFATLGMTEFRVRVGLRDVDSAKYVGRPELWDRAEEACRRAAATLGVEVSEEAGEASFYGPKIDFVVKDVIGRSWQLGTVQVDYNLPERFDLHYTGADNRSHRPVMIHRAPFGSMERFVGLLIEHFGGAFPTWLAPEQVRVLPVSDKSLEYAQSVLAALRAGPVEGIRATVDSSNERLQAKIKIATEWKIPYLLIVGPRDAEQGTVSVRARGHRKDLGALPLPVFVDSLAGEVTSRGGSTVIDEHFPAVAS